MTNPIVLAMDRFQSVDGLVAVQQVDFERCFQRASTETVVSDSRVTSIGGCGLWMRSSPSADSRHGK